MGKQKFRKKYLLSSQEKESYHVDSISCVDWNSFYKNIIASGSANSTVKVWDISKCRNSYTQTHHRGKISDIKWNIQEPYVLLTGSYDYTATLIDIRNPQNPSKSWFYNAKINSLIWSPFKPSSFFVTLQNGLVMTFDLRKAIASDPVMMFRPHKATCSLDLNPKINNLMATCGMSNELKLWNTSTFKPSLITSIKTGLGKCSNIRFSSSQPYALAFGGTNGLVSIWNVANYLISSRIFI